MNRVRARREELGLLQGKLAESAGLSRQSLNAIESGRTTPSVAIALRLARSLDSHVESLFGDDPADELEAVLGSELRKLPARVALAWVRDGWVAQSLSSAQFTPGSVSADGFVRRAARAGRVRVELCAPRGDLAENVFLGGCAPGLSVLADRLNGARGPGRFRWLMQSNATALRALSRNYVHIAGVHLGAASAEALGRTVARHLPTAHADVFALSSWEAGLVVQRGNPRRITHVEALGNARLRIAMRERGSGARKQLESMLAREGLNGEALAPRSVEVHNHMEVAHAVSLGAADVGFTIRSAAVAYDLDFVPLVEERFDLIVPSDLHDDPRIARLMSTLASGPFRRDLTALGYDASLCGARVARADAD